MIYTLTLNPALDYVIQVDNFRTGQMNRIKEEHIYYGGKGINVSWILKQLQTPTCALGFVAGFTGKELEQGLLNQGIQTDFIQVETGMTRINVKMKSEDETEINGQGPYVTQKELVQLKEKIASLTQGDTLVVSGNVPSNLPNNTYQELLESLDSQVCLVVDAEKELLKSTLAYHPFLIKPNLEELETLFSTKIETQDQIIHFAKQCQKLGAKNVLVSLSSQGSLLVSQQGQVIVQPTIQGQVINSVGAGDSMLAGVLAGYAYSQDWTHALQLGTACGAATAFGSGLATRQEIEEILEKIKE